MRIKFRVTKKDIQSGVPDASRCPISKAMRRKFPRCRPYSDTDFLSISIGKKRFEATPPARVAKFIYQFDKADKGTRKYFLPFTFHANFKEIN